MTKNKFSETTKYVIKLINRQDTDKYNYIIKDWISAFGRTEFFSPDAVFDTIQDAEEHIQKLINSRWNKDSTFEAIEVKQYHGLPFGKFYYTEKGYEEFKQYEGLFEAKDETLVFSIVNCRAKNNVRLAYEGLMRGTPHSLEELREYESFNAFLRACPEDTIIAVEISVYGYGNGKERAVNEREFRYLQTCYGRDEEILLNCNRLSMQEFTTNVINADC